MRESLSSPKYLDSDFAKFDRPLQIHLAFQALHEFSAKNNRLPKPRNEQDAEEIWKSTQELNEKLGIKSELDEKLIKLFAYGAAGDLAVFGGLVAQEVLKAVSGKFHPIDQYLYFDSLESLPNNSVLTEESCAPVSQRKILRKLKRTFIKSLIDGFSLRRTNCCFRQGIPTKDCQHQRIPRWSWCHWM
jgi:ubiquitin-activating enzyme E1